MKKGKHFKTYVKIVKDSYSEIFDADEKVKIFLDEIDILEVSGISKKQLDLYLFRHSEILRDKYKKKKIISIDILKYLLCNIKRKQNKKIED